VFARILNFWFERAHPARSGPRNGFWFEPASRQTRHVRTLTASPLIQPRHRTPPPISSTTGRCRRRYLLPPYIAVPPPLLSIYEDDHDEL
jgi:hypothetical protein